MEDGFIGGALLMIALVLEWRALGTAHLRRVLPSGRAALTGILVANVFLSSLWFKYFWIVFILFRIAQASEHRSTEPVSVRTHAGDVLARVADARGTVPAAAGAAVVT